MGNLCTSNDAAEMVLEPISASELTSPQKAPPSSSSSLEKPSNPTPTAAVAPNFAALNGSWTQSRTEGIDEFLKAAKVPWLVQKIIKSAKPTQELMFDEKGYSILMGGGPVKAPANEAKWGEEHKCKNPRGQEGILVCTYETSPNGDVSVFGKMTTETGVDIMTRSIVGNELELKIGPKQSARDPNVVMTMKRFFVRKE